MINAELTRLGVPSEIQAFFNVSAELSFNFGDATELYREDLHKVPTTENLWLAGTKTASNVIVSYSAMEAIAFLTINHHRYPKLEQLTFVAIGNRLHAEQVNWIRKNFRGRRFTLVFGKDLLGHITDIKLAAGLKNIAVRIHHVSQKVMIYSNNKLRIFDDERLSLNRFQLAFNIRSRVLTRKPARSSTFLNQLKYDTNR